MASGAAALARAGYLTLTPPGHPFPGVSSRLAFSALSRAGLLILLSMALWLPLAPQAEAQTTVTLVSNTGQARSGSRQPGGPVSLAQSFDTGSNAGGYNLDSIVLDFDAVPTSAGTVATVRADDSGSPSSTVLYTLTNPTLALGLNEFAAPSNATLDAGATYHVVLAHPVDNSGPSWDRTFLRNGLDAGASPGWAIDAAYQRNEGTSAWIVGSTSRALQMQVKGSAIGTTITDTTAPTVIAFIIDNSPTSADTLTWQVTFNEDVENVDATDFSVAGTTATLAVNRVGDEPTSQYNVTATGGNLASLDATVTLSFAATQNIQDIAGNALTNTTPTVTNDNTYVVDNTAPTVTSVVRQDPASTPTNSDTLTWRVTFNEDVDQLFNSGHLWATFFGCGHDGDAGGE